jgi:capsular polysaccharide transport system permease protein
VAQYIRSRAIVEDLSKELDLREVFRRPEADFLARLPTDASIEEVVHYWQQMVRSYVDAPSAIVTVQVRAFRPEDALKLATTINSLSEKLVNDISTRSRQDITRASEDETRQADARLRSALQELQAARDKLGILDPTKTAEDTGKLLLVLMQDKIRMEGELLAASRTLEPTAPSIRYMRSRVEIVDAQIATLKSSLAGKGGTGRNVAASLREFEDLERNRFVADKLLTIAEESLNRARKRAERQNLYVMVFVPPELPSLAEYPERFAYSILLPVAFLVLWGIGALLFAAVEDHRV